MPPEVGELLGVQTRLECFIVVASQILLGPDGNSSFIGDSQDSPIEAASAGQGMHLSLGTERPGHPVLADFAPASSQAFRLKSDEEDQHQTHDNGLQVGKEQLRIGGSQRLLPLPDS